MTEVKRAVLENARATMDASQLSAAPLLEAEVTLGGFGPAARFDATLRYRIPLEGLDSKATLMFLVPANEGLANPLIRLEKVEVQGVAAVAQGTSSRWEVPCAAVGGVADVVLHVAGDVPSFEARRNKLALERELDTLPALAHLLPEIPQLGAAASYGASGRLVVLGAALPALSGFPSSIHTLSVRGPAHAQVLATGQMQHEGAGQPARFAGVGHELAVLVIEQAELSREAIGGRELTLAVDLAEPGSDPDKALKIKQLIRRSVEGLEERLGRLEEPALSVLVSRELDGLGVMSLPGVLAFPVANSPLAAPRKGGQTEDWVARLDMVLAHHPGPKEAFERAVATAVARQFWRSSESGPLSRLIEHGLAAESALRVIKASHGDKAARRALELGWRLSYQLGRMRGAEDPSLIVAEPGQDPALGAMVTAKSGLVFEALARALGDEPWSKVTRELRALVRSGENLSDDRIRQILAHHAPRPEVALGLWTRWVHERRGDTDVGELRPEVLLEYLVTDGAVSGLSQALLDNAGEVAASPLGQKALTRLTTGEPLDTGFAIAMLGEFLGPSLDPTSRRWLELGTGLFSKENRKNALEGLIVELSGELGVPETDRARLGMLGGLVLDALDSPAPAEVPTETPPPE